ncbi:MAG: hypothetical protein A2494_02285 [Candidatus Lloydbacteria bacterium RIFOXYC12_FULL_46_25]|uniref:Peptidase C39 domain-containing protein n=1 Tax=Candidatus Lloydbacteria bacterium RIFOXYC12_FULL_46_25 TaxID=1798670 RepID=A0A1G2E4R8_9BACT|nr:MAG: hypothetical protein A2494_02285 [Candidatus Lloydbacteria bacterium RIFOXYC12_FULL_46_25]
MIPVAPVVTIPVNIPSAEVYTQFQGVEQGLEKRTLSILPAVRDVPFYSQFKDITSPKWKKVGCGIASLAMVIEYYEPNTVSVDKLLGQAIDSGAYQNNAGWIHKGLVSLSRKYGLDGKAYDLSSGDKETALKALKSHLKDGPVMVSVHYKFDPKSTIPHLAIINGIDGDIVYYNDPAMDKGGKQISTTQFLKAWKKRFIVFRPAKETEKVAMSVSPDVEKEELVHVETIEKDIDDMLVASVAPRSAEISHDEIVIGKEVDTSFFGFVKGVVTKLVAIHLMGQEKEGGVS